MSVADIIAARKAALLLKETSEEAPKIVAEIVTEKPILKEEPAIQLGKPLTFAEKMALKKGQQATSLPATPVQESLASALSAPMVQSTAAMAKTPSNLIEVIQKSIVSVIAEAESEASEDYERAEFKAAAEDVQRGYRDIKGRVSILSRTDDIDLSSAMSELKKALLSNPSACLLMLDQDIGKMTIALRRLTQEALLDATKEKTNKVAGKKSTKTLQQPLTEEQLAAVFAEL